MSYRSKTLSILLLLSACTAGDDSDPALETDTANATTGSETDADNGTQTPDPDTGSDTESETESEPDTDGTDETGETSDPTSGSSGEESLTFEAYLDAYNAAICNEAIACEDLQGPEHCDSLELPFHETRAAFENGELAFDGLAAADCIAVRAAQGPSCVSIHAELTPAEQMAQQQIEEACAPVLTGLVEIGDACNDFDACAGGPTEAHCAGLSSVQCMPGVCTAAPVPGGVGSECDAFDPSGAACDEGLFCRSTGMGGPSAGTCEALEEPGGECLGDDGCVPGSYCDFGSGVCEALAETGSPCAPNSNPQRPCRSALDYCHPVDEVCTPKLDLGEACDADTVCVSYGTCEAGTCVVRAGLNEACEPANPDACMGFSFCDPEQSICTHFEFPTCD